MRRTLIWTAVFTAAVVAACTSTPDATAPRRGFRPRFTTVVDNDSAKIASGHLQLIKGWGLDPGTGPNPFYDAPHLKAETLLYKSGITFIRDQIDPYLYDSGSTLANMLLNSDTLTWYENKWNAAKGFSLKYILSVWSPPAVWKTSGSLNGGQLKPTSEPSYVAFLTKVMEGLNGSSAGLPMSLSVANEPNYTNTTYPTTVYDTALWDTTLFNTRGSLNYLGYTGIATIGPELGTYDSTTAFLGDNSFTSIDSGYFASTAVSAYAFHGYGLCNWPSIATFMTNHPKDAWITEYSQPNLLGNGQLPRGIDVMGALGAQLTTLPINYWAWWLGHANADTDTVGGVLMLVHPSGLVDPTSMFYELNKLWKTVIPGTWYVQAMDSVWSSQLRIKTTGQSCTTPRVDLYAFEKPGDSTVVVVSNWTSDDKYIVVKGLPTSYTTQNAWSSDTTTINQPMKAQAQSTVWVGGDGTGRTKLYAPARSALIAILH